MISDRNECTYDVKQLFMVKWKESKHHQSSCLHFKKAYYLKKEITFLILYSLTKYNVLKQLGLLGANLTLSPPGVSL